MKIVNTLFCSFFISLILISTFSFTQENQFKIAGNKDDYSILNENTNLVSLGEILPILEKKFNINFFYNDDLIKPNYLKLSNNFFDNKNLETILSDLLTPFQLTYSNLNKSTYVIMKDNTIEIEKIQENGTIKGKVTDSYGNALPGVNIVVVGTTWGTTSDIEGNYQLSLEAGTYKLKISYVGYRSIETDVTVNEGEEVVRDFTLTEDILMLEQTIVTGTRIEQTQKEAPISIAILPIDQIQKTLSSQNPSEYLKTIPGIYATNSSGEIHPNVYTRGLPVGGGYSFITVEESGMPIGETTYREDLTIERIEVVKGGISILYGPGSPAAIVNYIPKVGGLESKSVIQFSTGEDNLYRMDFNTSGALGKDYFYSIGGFYRYDKGPVVTGLNSQGGQIKANLTKLISNGYIRLYGRFIDDQTQYLFGVPRQKGSLDKVVGEDGKEIETMVPQDAKRFSFQSPDGMYYTNAEKGWYSKGFDLQLDIEKQIGDWTIKNKTKYVDIPESGNADIVPTFAMPANVFAKNFIFNPTKEFARYYYIHHPERQFDNNNLDKHWIFDLMAENNDYSIYNIANDLQITRKFVIGSSVNNITLGAYFERGKFNGIKVQNDLFAPLINRPPLLGLQIVDSVGNVVRQISSAQGLFNNFGFGGGLYEHFIDESNTISIYVGDDINIEDKLRISIGFKYGISDVETAVEGIKRFTPTGETSLAMQNVRWGNGIFTYRAGSFDDWGGFLGLNYSFTPEFSVYGNVSRAYTFPAIGILHNVNRDATGTFIQPTPDKSQTFFQAEGGIKYISSTISGTFNLFYVDLNDLFKSWFRLGDDGVIRNVTEPVGGSRTIGIEASGVYVFPWVKGLRLNLSVTYQQHEYTEYQVVGSYGPDGKLGTNDDVIYDYEGNWTNRTPRFFFNTGLIYDNHPFDASINVFYAGKKYADDANEVELPTYTLVSIGAGYTFNIALNNSIRIGVYAYNIFDEQPLSEGLVSLPTGFTLDALPFYSGRTELPRRITAKLTYNF